MSRIPRGAERVNATGENFTPGIPKSEFVRAIAKADRVARMVGVVALVLSTAGYTQSLDRAVNSQLDRNAISGIPCAQLRGGQPAPATYLVGQLLTNCTRGAPSGGSGTSSSTGGGAATPTSLPGIVQQRLREAGDKRQQPAEKVTAASADGIVNAEGRGSFFVSVEDEKLNRNISAFEDGYRSKIQRLTVGADFGVTKRLIAGVALDASRQDINFKDGSDTNANSYGIVAYGAFQPADKLLTQGYIGYGRHSYDRRRSATFIELNSDTTTNFRSAPGHQAADYKANEYSAGMLAGYDHAIGSFTIRPFAAVDWKRTNFGTYRETGPTGLELTFYDNKVTSLQSSVGVRASVALRASSWVFLPQASINWKHEFENDQRTNEVSFVDDTRAKRFIYQTGIPDRDWGEINGGIAAILPNGMQIFGNYRTIVGNSIYRNHAVIIGLRLPF